MGIELLIDELEFETVEEMQTVKEVRELAMIEAGRICQDSLQGFNLIKQVGRVVLVSFCPENDADPIMPVVLGASLPLLTAAIGLYTVMNRAYAEISAAGELYVQAAQNELDGQELAFLRHQVQLCAVDPLRVLVGER